MLEIVNERSEFTSSYTPIFFTFVILKCIKGGGKFPVNLSRITNNLLTFNLFYPFLMSFAKIKSPTGLFKITCVSVTEYATYLY